MTFEVSGKHLVVLTRLQKVIHLLLQLHHLPVRHLIDLLAEVLSTLLILEAVEDLIHRLVAGIRRTIQSDVLDHRGRLLGHLFGQLLRNALNGFLNGLVLIHRRTVW